MWSGFFNFLGVLLSSGAVAVRHRVAASGRADPAGRLGRGLAMGCYALLIAAINLETSAPGGSACRLLVAHADRLDHRRRIATR